MRLCIFKLPADAVEIPDAKVDDMEPALLWECGEACIIMGSFKRSINIVYRRELKNGID
jgi:hypothetical protein